MVWFHNLWVRDWRMIVTLLGWVSGFAELFRMVFPDGPQAAGGVGTFVVIGTLFAAATMIMWKAYIPRKED